MRKPKNKIFVGKNKWQVLVLPFAAFCVLLCSVTVNAAIKLRRISVDVEFISTPTMAGTVEMLVSLSKKREFGDRVMLKVRGLDGVTVIGDTLWYVNLTGQKEYSFSVTASIPDGVESWIVVAAIDEQSGVGGGATRFFSTVGEGMRISKHPPPPKRDSSQLPDPRRHAKYDTGTRAFEAGIGRSSVDMGTGDMTLYMVVFPDKGYCDDVKFSLSPHEKVQVYGETEWVTSYVGGKPQYKDIDICIPTNDTGIISVSYGCLDSIGTFDLYFITTGDTAECWVSNPEFYRHPIRYLNPPLGRED